MRKVLNIACEPMKNTSDGCLSSICGESSKQGDCVCWNRVGLLCAHMRQSHKPNIHNTSGNIRKSQNILAWTFLRVALVEASNPTKCDITDWSTEAHQPCRCHIHGANDHYRQTATLRNKIWSQVFHNLTVASISHNS